MICQDACPGKRHCQKFQPLTGLPVMEIAAAEGESKRSSFSTSAPPWARARQAQGLTQAALARAVGLSRETLNLLESGLVRDLGIRKVLAVLDHFGLAIAIQPVGRPRRPDYVRMACTTANVSFKTALTEDALIHALVTGKVPAKRSAHLRALLDEAPEALVRGLVQEAARWTQPGKLEKNLRKLAAGAGATRSIREWMKID